jgi:hypothetical protein
MSQIIPPGYQSQILFSHLASSYQVAVSFLDWDLALPYLTKIVIAARVDSAELVRAWEVIFTQLYLPPPRMDTGILFAHSATIMKLPLEKLSRSVACLARISSSLPNCPARVTTAQPQLWPWWKVNCASCKQLIWIFTICTMTSGMLAKRKQLGGFSNAFTTGESSNISG